MHRDRDAAAPKCDPSESISAYPNERSASSHVSRKTIEAAIAGGGREGLDRVFREGLRAAFDKLAHRIQRAWEQKKFDKLAAEWKKETFLLSKIREKVIHLAYQKIIGMGPAAVPCILKDLRDNGPNHWFWALHVITEENPVPSEKVGGIVAMTEAWLQWGKKKGYLNSCQTTTRETSRT
jgi:hypothetical protein